MPTDKRAQADKSKFSFFTGNNGGGGGYGPDNGGGGGGAFAAPHRQNNTSSSKGRSNSLCDSGLFLLFPSLIQIRQVFLETGQNFCCICSFAAKRKLVTLFKVQTYKLKLISFEATDFSAQSLDSKF